LEPLIGGLRSMLVSGVNQDNAPNAYHSSVVRSRGMGGFAIG